jgi:hypothetical protein
MHESLRRDRFLSPYCYFFEIDYPARFQQAHFMSGLGVSDGRKRSFTVRRLSRLLIARAALAALGLPFSVSGAQDLFVDHDTGGSETGESWDSPFSTLQQALAVARPDTTIHIAEGFYYPDEGPDVTDDDTRASFPIRTRLTLLGGYEPDGRNRVRDPDQFVTALSGDITQSLDQDKDGIVDGYNGPQSAVIVTLDSPDAAPTLDGLLFSGSSFAAVNGPTPGIELRNCRFQMNEGRAVLVSALNTPPEYDDVIIESCLFQDNGRGLAGVAGGGLFVFDLDAFITDTDFIRNLNGDGLISGGAIGVQNSVDDNAFFELIRCRVKGNRSPLGGGIFLRGEIDANIVNVVISGNRAGNQGALSSGGGIYKTPIQGAFRSGNFVLTNCTVAWNVASDGAGGITLAGSGARLVTNSLLFKNYFANLNDAPASGIQELDNIGTVIYNASYDLGEPLVGNGNFDSFAVGFPTFEEDVMLTTTPTDSIFQPSSSGDLRLTPTSLFLNGGNNLLVPGFNTIDLAGDPRIQNGTVDLGAFETALGNFPIEILSTEVSDSSGTPTFQIFFDASGPVDVYASDDFNFNGSPIDSGVEDLFEVPITETKQFFILLPAGQAPTN